MAEEMPAGLTQEEMEYWFNNDCANNPNSQICDMTARRMKSYDTGGDPVRGGESTYSLGPSSVSKVNAVPFTSPVIKPVMTAAAPALTPTVPAPSSTVSFSLPPALSGSVSIPKPVLLGGLAFALFHWMKK